MNKINDSMKRNYSALYQQYCECEEAMKALIMKAGYERTDILNSMYKGKEVEVYGKNYRIALFMVNTDESAPLQYVQIDMYLVALDYDGIPEEQDRMALDAYKNGIPDNNMDLQPILSEIAYWSEAVFVYPLIYSPDTCDFGKDIFGAVPLDFSSMDFRHPFSNPIKTELPDER